MRYTVIGIIFIGLMAAGPGFARTRAPLGGDVGVEIISDSGTAFLTLPYRDFGNQGTRIIKSYLEAKKGEKYGIVIKNNTCERIGLVIAVDGRNIITGKQSNLGSREMMYIVNAYEHAKYDGWRTTDDEVHRFYFTSPPDSYSLKTFGDASAMGVIAVAVYREKERPQPPLEQKKNENAPPAPSAEGTARSMAKKSTEDRAGTGFGEGSYSPVIKVAFEPEWTPVRKTLLKYEWRETLCRKGIVKCLPETGNRLWDNEYASFPPDYREN
jgi:hypothetical protein